MKICEDGWNSNLGEVGTVREANSKYVSKLAVKKERQTPVLSRTGVSWF